MNARFELYRRTGRAHHPLSGQELHNYINRFNRARYDQQRDLAAERRSEMPTNRFTPPPRRPPETVPRRDDTDTRLANLQRELRRLEVLRLANARVLLANEAVERLTGIRGDDLHTQLATIDRLRDETLARLRNQRLETTTNTLPTRDPEAERSFIPPPRLPPGPAPTKCGPCLNEDDPIFFEKITPNEEVYYSAAGHCYKTDGLERWLLNDATDPLTRDPSSINSYRKCRAVMAQQARNERSKRSRKSKRKTKSKRSKKRRRQSRVRGRRGVRRGADG